MSPDLAVEEFREEFGCEPTILATAPGRVNLIGEHTDYNEGFVFPAAIDRGVVVAAKAVQGPSRLVSSVLGKGEDFEIAELRPGSVGGWSAYAAGIGWAFKESGYRELSNIDAFVSSDLPIGSGLSSSAAIEMAFAALWNELDGPGLAPKDLALLGQRAENRFVGVNCGVMDQMASAFGQEGCAMFLDTRSLEVRYAPIPDSLRIVVCDTGTRRGLAGSAYNERRSQCEEAARAFGVRSLRDATPELLDVRRSTLDPVVFRRAKHVITENLRCLAFVRALENNDAQELGRLMRQSHESLRDDYAVSCSELDAMSEAAWGAPGCVGARMTGAGFGGACVALVLGVDLQRFVASASTEYRRSVGKPGEFLPCSASGGARTWKP